VARDLTEPFNLHRAKHCRHLVVVEGFFDAIRLHGLRIPAVALMGTSVASVV
jgi:DNA primase